MSKTIRLTMAQALATFLTRQKTVIDGKAVAAEVRERKGADKIFTTAGGGTTRSTAGSIRARDIHGDRVGRWGSLGRASFIRFSRNSSSTIVMSKHGIGRTL